jgi:hypothetical protein
MKCLVVVLALSALSSVGNAQDPNGARKFVERLYSQYERPVSPDGPNILGESANGIFTPTLLRLIRKDQATTPDGFAPKLDLDPVCACQDSDGLHLLNLTITPVSSGATARVTISYSDQTKQELRLSLQETPQGWRIDDIATQETPSLRGFLQQR